MSNLPGDLTEADIARQYRGDISPLPTKEMLVRRYLRELHNGITTARTFGDWLKEYKGEK